MSSANEERAWGGALTVVRDGDAGWMCWLVRPDGSTRLASTGLTRRECLAAGRAEMRAEAGGTVRGTPAGVPSGTGAEDPELTRPLTLREFQAEYGLEMQGEAQARLDGFSAAEYGASFGMAGGSGAAGRLVNPQERPSERPWDSRPDVRTEAARQLVGRLRQEFGMGSPAASGGFVLADRLNVFLNAFCTAWGIPVGISPMSATDWGSVSLNPAPVPMGRSDFATQMMNDPIPLVSPGTSPERREEMTARFDELRRRADVSGVPVVTAVQSGVPAVPAGDTGMAGITARTFPILSRDPIMPGIVRNDPAQVRARAEAAAESVSAMNEWNRANPPGTTMNYAVRGEGITTSPAYRMNESSEPMAMVRGLDENSAGYLIPLRDLRTSEGLVDEMSASEGRDRSADMATRSHESIVTEWNQSHPVGTSVAVRLDAEGFGPDCFTGRTTTTAAVMDHPCVEVSGPTGARVVPLRCVEIAAVDNSGASYEDMIGDQVASREFGADSNFAGKVTVGSRGDSWLYRYEVGGQHVSSGTVPSPDADSLWAGGDLDSEWALNRIVTSLRANGGLRRREAEVVPQPIRVPNHNAEAQAEEDRRIFEAIEAISTAQPVELPRVATPLELCIAWNRSHPIGIGLTFKDDVPFGDDVWTDGMLVAPAIVRHGVAFVTVRPVGIAEVQLVKLDHVREIGSSAVQESGLAARPADLPVVADQVDDGLAPFERMGDEDVEEFEPTVCR